MPTMAAARLALGLFVDFLKHPFETFNLLFGLSFVLFKCSLELLVVCSFCHLRKGRQDLLLGVVNVLQSIVE